ncbi:MAG: diguanylate cyclase [Candidatus Wenzhouxiangella sp. M2_3B_020]
MAPRIENDGWIRDAMALNLGVSLLLDSGLRIVEAVGACRELLGREADELPGAMLTDLAEERDRDGIRQVLERLESEASVEFALVPVRAEARHRSHWRATMRDDGAILASGVDPGARAAQVTAILKMTDTLPTLIAYVDPELRYRFVNAAYERLAGMPRMALFGKAVADIVGEDAMDRLEPRMRRALNGERVRFEQTVRLRAGHEFRARTEYIPDEGHGGEILGFYAVIEDVSDYAEVIEMMRRVHETVHRAGLDHESTINELLNYGRDYLEVETGIVSDTRDGRYTVRHVVPADAGVSPGDVFPIGDTYCDIALRAGQLVATERAGRDPQIHGHPCYERFGLETYIGVPLLDRGKVVGTLNFSSAEPRDGPFSDLEMELVRLMGGAIERLLIQDRFEKGLFRSRLDMEKRAKTDSLTGAPNRAAIFSEFENLLDYRSAEGGRVSIALMDVDHFKRINDRYGHQVGDKVLVELSETLKEAIRQGDAIGRVGGEEFLLLLPDAGLDEARGILERIRQRVESMSIRSENGEAVSVTISVGVAEAGGDDDVDRVYSRADKALYRAKEAGRNRIKVAD